MVIPMHDASFISMIPKSDLVVLFDDLRLVLSAMSQADEIFDGRLDMNRFGSVIQSQVLPAMETFNEHFIPIDEAVGDDLERTRLPSSSGGYSMNGLRWSASHASYLITPSKPISHQKSLPQFVTLSKGGQIGNVSFFSARTGFGKSLHSCSPRRMRREARFS